VEIIGCVLSKTTILVVVPLYCPSLLQSMRIVRNKHFITFLDLLDSEKKAKRWCCRHAHVIESVILYIF
jgi:hypothetical protein